MLRPMKGKVRRVALAATFAVLIFVSKAFVPTPFDKAMILPQATLLTLASLLLPRFGATTTSIISGLLVTILRPGFAPLSLILSIIYGALLDFFISLFRAKSLGGDARLGRLLAAVSTATALVGLVSYYVTVYLLTFMPPNPFVDAMILLAGFINGVVAGFLAKVIWGRIKHIV